MLKKYCAVFSNSVVEAKLFVTTDPFVRLAPFVSGLIKFKFRKRGKKKERGKELDLMKETKAKASGTSVFDTGFAN